MHYHKKNYFKGGVSESAQIKVHTIDYKSCLFFLSILLFPDHKSNKLLFDLTKSWSLVYN